MEKVVFVQDEGGSVLVVALIMIVLLTIIGLAATTTTETEIRIAGNEKFYSMAFYMADGGTEAGTELLEQNIASRGFDASPANVTVSDLDFYTNETSDTSLDTPTETNWDVTIPNVGGENRNIYLKIYGDTELSKGSAMQIGAGYEGKGKGLGGGGAFVVYNVRSIAKGPANSQSRVWLRWRHLI